MQIWTIQISPYHQVQGILLEDTVEFEIDNQKKCLRAFGTVLVDGKERRGELTPKFLK